MGLTFFFSVPSNSSDQEIKLLQDMSDCPKQMHWPLSCPTHQMHTALYINQVKEITWSP